MGSPTNLRNEPWSASELPQPYSDPNLARTFAGYRQALSRMSTTELMKHLTDINGSLASEQKARLAQTISAMRSRSLDSIDNPVVRSRPTAPQPSEASRGKKASQPAPSSPSPTSNRALDLLASSRRLAPRIAAKLVMSEAKRAAREE